MGSPLGDCLGWGLLSWELGGTRVLLLHLDQRCSHSRLSLAQFVVHSSVGKWFVLSHGFMDCCSTVIIAFHFVSGYDTCLCSTFRKHCSSVFMLQLSET